MGSSEKVAPTTLKAHFDPFRRAASGLAAGLRPASVAARASQVGKQPSAMSRQNLVPQTPVQVGVTSSVSQ